MAFFKNILKPVDGEDATYAENYAANQADYSNAESQAAGERRVTPSNMSAGAAYLRNMPNSGEIVLVEASDIAGAQEIALHFKRGASVVCDLSNMNATDFQRSLDFISGVAFVLEGNFTKVSREIYLLMPKNVTYRTDKSANDIENQTQAPAEY